MTDDDDDDDFGAIDGINEWQRKLKYSEKTCPSADLSKKDSKGFNPGSNPGHSGNKPATNLMAYSTAVSLYSSITLFHYFALKLLKFRLPKICDTL
jgi:hypothetical protein